ncbi:MAG: pilus assembly protein TadG-related protein [Acidobacteriota bacterium]
MARSESGQATVFMVAFMGMVMLGFLAFAVDVGYFFHMKRMAQAAADAAAVAAAEEDGYTGNSGNAQAVANAAATMNGFNTSAATNPATVTLTVGSSGNYSNAGSGNPGTWVQAVVSQPISGYFLSAFNHGSSTMTVSATASAGEGMVSPTCICLEAPTGRDLNLSNNSKITATGCGVTLDSTSSNTLGIVGSANLNSLSLGTVATGWNNSSNINNNGSIAATTDIVTGISASCAPPLPPVPSYSSCTADPFNSISGGGAKYTVGPGSTYGTTTGGNTICYNALTVNGNGDTVTLNPGIYVINGGSLHFESGANKGGTGVTFYLLGNASVTIDNGANVNITAPTAGTYANVLIFQDPADTKSLSIQGGSTAVMSGAIYATGAGVTLGNGSGTSISADIVAQTLTMNGGGTLSSTPTANLGSMNISTAKLSQ